MPNSRSRIYILGGSVLALLALLVAQPTRSASTFVLPLCNTPAIIPTLIGTTAYVEDLATHAVIIADNADAQLPLASLTKLMTIDVASSILASTSTVTITPAALTPDGDAGLVVGEKWRASDLMTFTLIESANDGAHALALAASDAAFISLNDFIDRMNAEAHTLGLTNTYFINDTGLDESASSAGAYGSARDVATLLTAVDRAQPGLMEGAAVADKRFVSLSGIVHTATHTSALTGVIPGEVAVKTGFTDLAGGNIALVVEPIPGHPTVVVVLGSTRDGRDTDAATLIKLARTAERRAILCQASEHT